MRRKWCERCNEAKSDAIVTLDPRDDTTVMTLCDRCYDILAGEVVDDWGDRAKANGHNAN